MTTQSNKTIAQVFDLPGKEDIAALGFVVRLEEQASGARDRKLVAEYVLTPGVQVELPRIFDKLRRSVERGEDLGWFIHGSFGSGKSHLMSLLGLLLEDEQFAWEKPHEVIQALEAAHRSWISQRRPLVVRLHMLTGADRHGAGLDRAVYRAANKALERAGLAQFSYFDVGAVFEEVREEARLYGAKLWQNLANAGLIESEADFHEVVAGPIEDQEEWARLYLTEYKKRSLESAGFELNWAEGLQRLARHVQAQGRGALVLLIDEFLLWLSEKSGPEFRQAINDLNTIVDHSDGSRAIPVSVFVARQRNITEFFPDLVQEKDLYEHLDHHAQRFELTTLQDVELRHICRERVLKRRDAAAVEDAIERLVVQQVKVFREVMHNADIGYLRDVYPFHPALIEALIDISSLMQRERTALRLLYELLIVHHPDLELGEFLPVGSVFEAIFPPSGVEGSKRLDDLRSIHSFYWQRILPALEQLYEDPTNPQRRVLDQLLKTALLAKVSPRLRGAGEGMALERLLLLNEADVEGFSERGKLSSAFKSLQEMTRLVPDILLHGQGTSASVDIVLHGVNFGELLDRARREVDHVSKRFATFHRVFKELLGLDQNAGFREQGHNEGERTVRWRGTARVGTVALLNVREAPHKRFQTGAHAWRLMIDYPWDEPGYNVQHDRLQIDKVRKGGAQYTLCWLPAHFTAPELGVLLDLSATTYLQEPEGQERLLGMLSQADRQRVVEQARTMGRNLEEQLREILCRAYQDQGEVKALVDGIGQVVPHRELHKNLDYFAGVLLDRWAPNHPSFEAEPTLKSLNTLLGWMVEAMEQQGASHQAIFDEVQAKALRELGLPLELVSMGQSRATLRTDTRYFKVVTQHLTGHRFLWSNLDEQLVRQFGLSVEVRNLFLMFLVRGHSYRLIHQVTGEVVAPPEGVDGRLRADLYLEPAPVLALASWSQARDLTRALFPDLKAPQANQRTVSHQDAWAKQLGEQAHAAHAALLAVRERLRELEVPDDAPRVAQADAAMARLAPLLTDSTDSHARMTAWLALWPVQSADATRLMVSRAGAQRDALRQLPADTLQQLRLNRDRSPQAQTLLASLDAMLASTEAAHSLTAKEIERWSRDAGHLSKLLMEELLRVKDETRAVEAARKAEEAARLAEARALEAEARAAEAEAARKAAEVEAARKAAEAEERRLAEAAARAEVEAARKVEEERRRAEALAEAAHQAAAAEERRRVEAEADADELVQLTMTVSLAEAASISALVEALRAQLGALGSQQVEVTVVVRKERR